MPINHLAPLNMEGVFKKTGEIYTVTFERVFSAPVSKVWEYISQTDKLGLWLTRTDLELEIDGNVAMYLPNVKIVGKVTQLKPESLLEYFWESKSEPGEVSVVRWELFKESDGRCRLLFFHRMIPPSYRTVVAVSWHIFLQNLADVLNESGSPLPRLSWEEAHEKYQAIVIRSDIGKNISIVQPEAKAEMYIKRPIHEVYDAFINPEITTKFWFTHSSNKIEAGRIILWKWEKINFEQNVIVTKVEKDSFISFVWSASGVATTVEMSFTPLSSTTTSLRIVEKGWSLDDEHLIPRVVGQTEAWALVNSSLKAYLELGILINVINERYSL